MPLLAPLKPFFDAMTAPTGQPRPERPVAEARADMHAMIEASFTALMDDRSPLPLERDHRLRVDGGEIVVRVYRPIAATAPLPCYIYHHGGGFWLGTLSQADSTCRALAVEAECVVVSVDYRLAPEHPFPAAAEDSYAALLWVVDQAGSLGIDSTRIAVGGGSAGGNLAAVVSLMARDRGGPRLVLQVLEIPVTDFTRLGPLEFPAEKVTLYTGKEQFGHYYLPNPELAKSSYASPLLAPTLACLPPALVMTAEYDALRPEGAAYALRLEQAGVRVSYRCWEGQFHGSQTLFKLIPHEAAAYQARVVQALRQAFVAA